MGSAERFIMALCILLVGILTGIICWTGGQEDQGSFTDGVVKVTLPVDSATEAAATKTPIAPTHNATEVAITPRGEHALDPALDIARTALAKFRSEVDDYAATMIKRERIAGVLGGEMRMEVKVRTRRIEEGKLVRPLQVYLKVLDPWLARGREVVWVEGRNENKLIAHEGGLKNLIRVSLAPTDKLAMMGNKYPITEIGLEKLMEKLIEKGERDRLVGPCEVKIESGSEVGGRPCQLIQVVHPERDARFDFHIAQIFIDQELQIPLRYASFMWPENPGDTPPLEEEYTYLDVRLNVGLSDIDFDPQNPAYRF